MYLQLHMFITILTQCHNYFRRREILILIPMSLEKHHMCFSHMLKPHIWIAAITKERDR